MIIRLSDNGFVETNRRGGSIIKLPDERYEEIKRIVVKLFVDYGVSCVPVNGFELAAKMGITVVPYSALPLKHRPLLFKKSEDGFCVEKEEGEWYTYYNDAMEYGRINNTIFHEIGHIALDHTEDSELAEKEVKFFAKYALVPPVLVHKLGLTDVNRIAEVFEVSLEAAGYALSYYKKWLKYGGADYTPYERELLDLFSETA